MSFYARMCEHRRNRPGSSPVPGLDAHEGLRMCNMRWSDGYGERDTSDTPAPIDIRAYSAYPEHEFHPQVLWTATVRATHHQHLHPSMFALVVHPT